MTDFDTISTDTWTIALPSDWEDKGEDDGSTHYFESADGSKGVYLNTWFVDETDDETPTELAEMFRAVDMETLEEMEDCSWRIMSDETQELPGATISVTDALAEASTYRIVGKILVRPPVVVRAAFHDYECTQYEESLAFFAPIIQSLNFSEGED